MNNIWILLYYTIGFHLPSRYYPFGRKFSKIRAFLVKRILKSKCGTNLEIEGRVLLGKFDDITIGNNVQINENSRLRNVKIGDDVMIAPSVYILHSGHNFESKEISMRFQGDRLYPETIIEDDVWIGACSIINAGKKIGKGSIVATGSVVTKDIEPFTIVGGNPAMIIRKR